ncbi:MULTISPECIES: ribbon-helix-helix domain-containing protein [unclassified Rhizobium]|uniref:ribbon-helix-helix domain-containing protein n=1 Tax=unclassified Rhizobium TaxID=2613769 RepID=UPI0006F77F0B|nr:MULTISPECIES: ribbon-helix-helix domain-containing protein [unclassified Rhizobium]KQV43423.1 hypothetical protein ASC86_00985 [Rhizobium sp. Root1212]KRD37609.1 hypothetical protein ASE37_00985 [Rhizobium sp. Root268]
MSTRRSFNISLPSDLVEQKVAAGEYATESELITDGLRTLIERDAELDTWLREDVLPLARKVEDGSAETMTAEETWKRLRVHMDRRVTGAK